MGQQRKAVIWFRRDLRVADNPALAHAVDAGETVVPLFIHHPESEGAWPDGAASRWWLHYSLEALQAALRALGSQLVLRSGDPRRVLLELCRDRDVGSVYWNRRYEPSVVARDTEIKKALVEAGVEVRSFNGSLLQSPLSVSNKSGTPFKVFTPFWKHIRGLAIREPLPAPRRVEAPERFPHSEALDSFELLPKIPWDEGLRASWTPGEQGAEAALQRFAREAVDHYATARDAPAEQGVSRLSPSLHFGELSPNQVWARLDYQAHEPFLRQLGWREFAHHLLLHFPDTPEKPLRPEFERFPWRRHAKRLEAWQKGRTGYPMVDAGMRELWQTGWMHNRVRMVVGSFLVKHLLIPWQEGAAWFWDTLVDADLANNTMGWQWIAGCGADAAPYFRIFNPIAQGERFDPEGAYTRRWVPELAKLPQAYLFQPWQAPAEVLRRAGVQLGKSYPKPIVEHKAGRQAALDAYRKMRDAS